MHVIKCDEPGYPGSISLPLPADFEDKHFEAFFELSEANTPEDKDEDGQSMVGRGYRGLRGSALTAADFIDRFGKWDIEEMTLASYKEKSPVLFTYWLHVAFSEYMTPFLAPNLKRNSTDGRTTKSETESPQN